MADRQAAAAAIDAFLHALGVSSADTEGTGARVAQMFADDLCAGYAVDTQALAAHAVIATSRPGVVVVRDIAVTTTCPHHLLPALGKATVGFHARAKVIGIGTVVALVDAYARRLALQETIGENVVDELQKTLDPIWVACRLTLVHGCMVARGERAVGTSVETIAARGEVDWSALA